jgi:hypothetical protein
LKLTAAVAFLGIYSEAGPTRWGEWVSSLYGDCPRPSYRRTICRSSAGRDAAVAIGTFRGCPSWRDTDNLSAPHWRRVIGAGPDADRRAKPLILPSGDGLRHLFTAERTTEIFEAVLGIDIDDSFASGKRCLAQGFRLQILNQVRKGSRWV